MQESNSDDPLRISALIVYAEDVAVVIRKKRRKAVQLLKDIRFALNKEDHHAVTLGELCAYLNIALLPTFALLQEKGMF